MPQSESIRSYAHADRHTQHRHTQSERKSGGGASPMRDKTPPHTCRISGRSLSRPLVSQHFCTQATTSRPPPSPQPPAKAIAHLSSRSLTLSYPFLTKPHQSLTPEIRPFPSLTSRASTAAPRPASAFTAAMWPFSAAQCRGIFPCGGRGASGAARRAARVMRERSETGGRARHVTRRHFPGRQHPLRPPRRASGSQVSADVHARCRQAKLLCIMAGLLYF